MSGKPGKFGRLFLLMETLAGHVLDGLSGAELSDATGLSSLDVLRDMETLNKEGMAHKLGNGRWALTTRPLAIAIAYQRGMNEAVRTHYEIKKNVDAEARRVMN